MGFGTLFPRNNKYTDNGELITANIQEFAGKYSTQIINSVRAVTADTTIYTVPANKILYITAMWVNARIANATFTQNAEIKINPAGATVYLIRVQAGRIDQTTTTDTTGHLSISFPMPIRLEATRTVILVASASGYSGGGFAGWLENA